MANQHARHEGIWTGLLKWSLAQPGFADESSNVKEMNEEDKAFLKHVFDSLVVDEVKRMRIITEILKMPDDQPGIARLLQESSAALEKLDEVHRSASQTEVTQHSSASAASLAPSPPPIVFKSPSPTALAEAASLGPVPTLSDYKNASIAQLQEEMIRRKEGALEELDDRVITADNANDFITVGGLEPLLISMLSPHDGIKWRAAQVLSTMTQNNPKCQKLAFEHQAINYLLPLLTPPPIHTAASSSSSTSSPTPALDEAATQLRWTVVVKALTALSALIRADDLPQIQSEFIKQQGFAKLIHLLTHAPHATDRVLTKVYLFLRHVLQSYPNYKPHMVVALPQLVQHIGTSHEINHREAILKLLVQFSKKSEKPKETADVEKARKELRRKELGLKRIIADRLKTLQDLSKHNEEDKLMYEEEINLLTSLNKLCKF